MSNMPTASFLTLPTLNAKSLFSSIEGALKMVGHASMAECKDDVVFAFIAKQIEIYQEPTREGTPRGERIGLSRTKFLAVLLGLTTLPLECAAQVVGVSYGLLRKWRTENVFHHEVLMAARQFVHHCLLPELRRAHESQERQFNKELSALSFKAIMEGPYLERDDFTDQHCTLSLYSDPVEDAALAAMKELTRRPIDDESFKHLGFDDVALLGYFLHGLRSPGQRRPERSQVKKMIQRSIDKGMRVLANPGGQAQNELSQKQVVHAMRTAKELLQDL